MEMMGEGGYVAYVQEPVLSAPVQAASLDSAHKGSPKSTLALEVISLLMGQGDIPSLSLSSSSVRCVLLPDTWHIVMASYMVAVNMPRLFRDCLI